MPSQYCRARDSEQGNAEQERGKGSGAIDQNCCRLRDGLQKVRRSHALLITPSPSSSYSSTTTPSPTTSPTQTPRPVWNPFWPRIINSIHFYGYGGSLTEPPCSEWVAWRVLDTPMQISLDQWEQMRNILFNQVDEKCHRTSVHYEGSVARPTQSLNGRPLWKCSVNDYVSDVEKRMKSTSSRN